MRIELVSKKAPIYNGDKYGTHELQGEGYDVKAEDKQGEEPVPAHAECTQASRGWGDRENESSVLVCSTQNKHWLTCPWKVLYYGHDQG